MWWWRGRVLSCRGVDDEPSQAALVVAQQDRQCGRRHVVSGCVMCDKETNTFQCAALGQQAKGRVRNKKAKVEGCESRPTVVSSQTLFEQSALLIGGRIPKGIARVTDIGPVCLDGSKARRLSNHSQEAGVIAVRAHNGDELWCLDGWRVNAPVPRGQFKVLKCREAPLDCLAFLLRLEHDVQVRQLGHVGKGMLQIDQHGLVVGRLETVVQPKPKFREPRIDVLAQRAGMGSVDSCHVQQLEWSI